MIDIVERLRDPRHAGSYKLLYEAATEIDKLRAMNAILREQARFTFPSVKTGT